MRIFYISSDLQISSSNNNNINNNINNNNNNNINKDFFYWTSSSAVEGRGCVLSRAPASCAFAALQVSQASFLVIFYICGLLSR